MYNNRTDAELVVDLAELCRTYAKQKLAVANTEREMQAVSSEVARRLAANGPQLPDSDRPALGRN